MSGLDASAALEALIEAIADRVVAKLTARSDASAAPALTTEAEAARRCGVETKTIRAARRGGEIKGRRVGRRVLVELAAVEQWIRSRPEIAAPEERTSSDPLTRAIAAGKVVRLRGAK